MKFTFLDDAQETYDLQRTPDVQVLEDQVQSSDQYYCGLCRGFVSIETPCVHHPSK